MKKPGTIHTGTSGWSYSHWRGPFYPETLPAKKLLSYYFEHFRTVEVNSSFYRLPLKQTFENWSSSSPDDFVFAVKASRFITHIKRLTDAEEAVSHFFERAEGLGEKIGPILFQLPPGLKRDAKRLGAFLEGLPAGYRYAFEFRNPTWFEEGTYSLLAGRGAAFCIYELGGRVSPLEVTSDFVYVRLHGPGGPYRGRYTAEMLARWYGEFEKWARESREVFCYFDNDEEGFAALNALEMRDLVRAGAG